MRNDILIASSVLLDVPGLAVIVTPVFGIGMYTAVLIDTVIQRVGGVDSSVFIRVQQSDDGVLWHDPIFVGVIGTTAAIPRPRVVTGATPSRRFGRVTFSSQNVNPTNLDYTIQGRTNA